MSYRDNFGVAEIIASSKPFALSPIPNTSKLAMGTPLLSSLTGVRNLPNLGLNTSWFTAATDRGIVGRTWGLFSVIPSRKHQFYGPNFAFAEYRKTRSWLSGAVMHYGTALFLLLFVLPPFRAVIRRFVHQPGEGPDREQAEDDRLEYRATGNPDLHPAPARQAYARAAFDGSIYRCELTHLPRPGLLSIIELIPESSDVSNRRRSCENIIGG
jgi:hypothetical protein